MSRDPPFATQASDDLLRQQDRTPNFAQPVRDREVDEIEKLERSVVLDMNRIQSAMRPLESRYPLTEINSQPLPGVLSFSQARDLEQGMASDNPGNTEVPREKEFNLFRVGHAAQYGLYKWCKIFGVMTKARRREGEHTPSAPKYVEALRNAFTVETQDSGAGEPRPDPSGPALFGRRGFVTRSIGYYHRIIQSRTPLLDKIKNLLLRMACLR